MKKANRGGTAPYWLGAAQLEAGGSCPVGLEGPSHRRERPLALHSTPVEQQLNAGNCRSLCCINAMGVAGVSSPGVVRGVLVCGVIGN